MRECLDLRYILCFLWLAVGAGSCGGAPPLPTQGLSAEQLEFATFLPKEHLLDLRATRSNNPMGHSPGDGPKGIRLGQGWSTSDGQGRWALGTRSTVLVHLADPAGLNFFAEYRSPGVESIGVRINGVEVGELASQSTWNRQLLTLSDGVLRSGENAIELSYVPGPDGFPIRTDDGWLTVYFRLIGVVATKTSVDPEDLSIPLDRSDGTITIGEAGTLLIPLRSDQPMASVTVGVSGASRWWRPMSITLRSQGPTGVPVPMMQKSLAGLWGRSSASMELSLDGLSGPGCFLIDVDLDPSSPPLRLDLFRTEAISETVSVEPPRFSEPPDIVLIILDAARADHFDTYGYPRETSPNIGRLAADSLVFEHVFATAPYTLSSMSTMLTGLSFVQHGVIGREHKMSELVTTLAEYLREAGYRTTCLTANPNNSVRNGLEQGCDLFQEFWLNAAPPVSLDPFRVSDRAVEALAEVSDAPLFLMLHYVPPHEPYSPPAEFDIFGDREYQGGYDGGLTTLRAIDDGEFEPTQADLDEIVSLYDGNLLTGDNAVGIVLDALRRRERWEQTVVLVTSDHGEAFGEHGRMGHNSTVYDEMLHVPFILRLPEGRRPSDVDTESIASLADVTPTLVRLAGVEPRGRLYGQDLLALRTTGRQRVVSRSGGERPYFSFRTAQWKAIQGSRITGELYDVVADPDERNDRYLEDYITFACFDALLQWELTGAGTASADGTEQELSEEELRTLRSLGYVR